MKSSITQRICLKHFPNERYTHRLITSTTEWYIWYICRFCFPKQFLHLAHMNSNTKALMLASPYFTTTLVMTQTWSKIVECHLKFIFMPRCLVLCLTFLEGELEQSWNKSKYKDSLNNKLYILNSTSFVGVIYNSIVFEGIDFGNLHHKRNLTILHRHLWTEALSPIYFIVFNSITSLYTVVEQLKPSFAF